MNWEHIDYSWQFKNSIVTRGRETFVLGFGVCGNITETSSTFSSITLGHRHLFRTFSTHCLWRWKCVILFSVRNVHYISESKTGSTWSLIAVWILYQSNDLSHFLCNTYSCTHVYTYMVCVCVHVHTSTESVCVSSVFISKKYLHILHASVSTPSFCLPALQLFSSYFSLFLYQRGKKKSGNTNESI